MLEGPVVYPRSLVSEFGEGSVRETELKYVGLYKNTCITYR